MPRPLVATIDIDAMRHNLALATKLAAGAKVWAVVKANAYGHGLQAARLGFAGAHGLSLIEFDNAMTLRESGWVKPLLMLEGCFDMADLQVVMLHRLQIVVHCRQQIEMLELAQQKYGGSNGNADSQYPNKKPIDIHLKLNSGMNRLGFAPDAYVAAYKRLRALDNVGKITLMTHFANADDAPNRALPLAKQVDCFEAVTAELAGFGSDKTLANSAVDLMYPNLAADSVRPGVMLYGGSPGAHSADYFNIRPAMTLTSKIIGIQEIKAGDSVGYGSRFTATQPMRIGIVACGYADGYPRHAPDGTPVLVEAIRTGIVGRVSMDMLCVDLTPIPQANVGSAVTLWGDGLPIDEVATMAGTIGYELMCALAPRVKVQHAERGVDRTL